MNKPLNYPYENVHSIILCGGSGTRLWPLSRKNFPKQFLTLGGEKNSLIQQCINRLKNMSPAQNRWLVTIQEQEEICRQLVGDQVSNYLIEPTSRNTAPAIALAAWNIYKKDPNSTMVIVSSDHAIQNIRSFEQSIQDAIELAHHNLFVTIGIKPNAPATSFGYIELGLPLDSTGNIISLQKASKNLATGYSVRSFREKPHLAAAEQFLRTGKYLWNAGIFVWKTKNFLDAFEHLQPQITSVIKNENSPNFQESYSQLENISIDVAFMEQTSHVACVPAHFDWSDVGSWSAVKDCFMQDDNGNSISGHVYAHETNNCVIHSSKPFISVIGLENLAVVATQDSVLVMPLSRSQEVKKIISYLEQNKPELL